MGFRELVENGYKPARITVSIPRTSVGGIVQGATSRLGSTYVLLGAFATKPCRVRLYSTTQSVALDNARPSGSFDINPDVGLNLEVLFEDEGPRYIPFNPPVIGTAFDGTNTWYNISSSAGSPNVQITAYPIEVEGTIPRQALHITRSVSTGVAVSGSIVTPNSFLILSASSNSESRLRLYSTTLDNVSTTEKTRTFGTQPPTGSKLIADLMFDSASFAYKINPILEAYTWDGIQYSTGTNVVYYIMENLSVTSPAAITSSVQIISLED
jgi:hypothetical protein